MVDVEQILKMLDDLLARVEEIKAAVAGLQERAPAAAPPGPANVIPPTRTDDPDSIVGGKRVRRGDFADCCAVGDETEWYCSGTLIAPNVVVTAGHCDLTTRVYLKGNDVSRAGGAEIINIKKVTDDSGFESLLDFRHRNPKVDLRVLVLERDSTVPPRRIARESDLAGVSEATLVGFGMVDLAGKVGYGVKRRVKVPLMTLDCTEPGLADKFGCREGYEIVAGHRGLLRDSCKGDSGGPLYIQAEDGSYLLLGATARGAWGRANECGDGGIYVRVDQFLDWIREVTGAAI